MADAMPDLTMYNGPRQIAVYVFSFAPRKLAGFTMLPGSSFFAHPSPCTVGRAMPGHGRLAFCRRLGLTTRGRTRLARCPGRRLAGRPMCPGGVCATLDLSEPARWAVAEEPMPAFVPQAPAPLGQTHEVMWAQMRLLARSQWRGQARGPEGVTLRGWTRHGKIRACAERIDSSQSECPVP